MITRSSDELPFGASVIPQGVRFRVWAPKARRVEVAVSAADGEIFWPLEARPAGVYEGVVPEAGDGTRYRYRLDQGPSFPDPWSRAQPEGVHGRSQVVDPQRFQWSDADWSGLDPERLVIYEIHVGTFTPTGTFDALIPELAELRRLGITAIELMPVAEFPGRWNWGYDGVDLFAPTRNYGGPAGLRRLVHAAHRAGLGVILDVVYNHLGPDGNYLRAFSDDYFTDRYTTPWGEAINYDGPGRERVREFVAQNAAYWVREYHLDGLRLDATHAIYDNSPVSILAEIAETARAAGPPGQRPPLIIAEDGRNETRLIRPRAARGYGLDAIWADDFHHITHRLLTGECEGYYQDYEGNTAALGRTIQEGLFFQGQFSRFRQGPRGTLVTDEPAHRFVFCIQNHDQIGNRALGERLNQLVDPARYAVASTLLLLAPETPLIFMGQEFAARTPFLYFTDHRGELGRLVSEGRRREFAGFSAFHDPARQAQIPDPQAEETFRRSKLDRSERAAPVGVYRLYQALLRLRRRDPVFARPSRQCSAAGGLGEQCCVMWRWSEDAPSDRRLVIANFGEPLALPLDGSIIDLPLGARQPRLLLSTDARRFGGEGRRIIRHRKGEGGRLVIPEATAVVLSVT